MSLFGESQQTKGFKKLYNWGQQEAGKGLDLYGYPEMSGALDKRYNTDVNNINRMYGQKRTQTIGNTASRLASQGITGGSTYNSLVGGAGNQIDEQQANILGQLLSGRQGQETNLMQNANNDVFRKLQTQMALRQLGIEGLPSGTTADDIFAIINTLGNIGGTVAKFI